MKEWFKARTIWGAAIETLSDAEAGRLMKAIWRYAMSGEQTELTGAEKGIFALVLMTMSQDEAQANAISAKRAEAGSLGGKQKVANAIKCYEDVANVANAINKNQNKNIEKDIEKESILTDTKEKVKRFTPPTLEEVRAYCQERENHVDAQVFVDFYASKGWKVGNSPMKDWKACVRTWERNRSITPVVKQVVAQQYTQRDYSDEDEEAFRRMLNGSGVQAL